MGEDELQEANEEKIETERLDILHKAGIISAEQYAELAGVDFGGDGIIKSNSAKNEIGGGQNKWPTRKDTSRIATTRTRTGAGEHSGRYGIIKTIIRRDGFTYGTINELGYWLTKMRNENAIRI